MGRAQYTPTPADRNTVTSMAACGFNENVIATCIGEKGIAAKTLRKHFRRELDVSQPRANASVAQRLWQKAMDGDVIAMIFWCKTRLGWRDITRLEHTGMGAGGAIELNVSAVEHLESRIARLAARAHGDHTLALEPGGGGHALQLEVLGPAKSA